MSYVILINTYSSISPYMANNSSKSLITPRAGTLNTNKYRLS